MKALAAVAVLACLNFPSVGGEPAGPGAGPFQTDADGFIQNWLVLEPIRLNNIQHTDAGVREIVGRDDLKGPLTALPRAGDKFTGAAAAAYEWHSVPARDYLVDLTGFASDYHKPMVSVVFYGIAYVTAPEDMKDARLAIGSDDDSIWWLNGKEVVSAFGVRQTSTDDNVSKRLVLNQGVNILRFAVIQGDGPSGCCARFYDARQRPITNLTISLNPPGGMEGH